MIMMEQGRISENKYHTHIEAKTRLLSVDLKELWRYRDLILLFTRRSFVVTYKQTILGPAWIILNPFITSVIYTIVFGGIAGISTNGVPQLLFYMGSNAVWTYFATCFNRTATTFTANAGVFGKVYFPRLTMPISTVLSAAINFAIQLLMFGFFFIYYLAIGEVHPNWFAIPLLFLAVFQLGCLGLGCGVIVSSLTTKYRDLAIVVSFGIQLWMYASPVVYPMSQLEDPLFLHILHVNPVSASMETFRYVLLGTGEISLGWWVLTIVITAALLFFGVILFNKVEKTFMDTV
jgi:lipopolysaccharide transport system permease protein